ncbi:hypothetical protein AAHC03_0779 [Spirometra sp. Aus1]
MSPWLLVALYLLRPAPLISGQLIDTVSVLENSEVGTVVYDLRERLLQTLSIDDLANVTAYAGQQDLFWPFALKDLRIIVARRLDREAICSKQNSAQQSAFKHRNQFSGVDSPHAAGAVESTTSVNWNPQDCPTYDCCQLLPVNVIISPTSPTQVFFIRVAVQDVNDNAPSFPHVESPFATIPEDVAVGTRIFLPEAVDADSRPFGVVEYRITKWIQGNASHFQLVLVNAMSTEEGAVTYVGQTDKNFAAMAVRPALKVVSPLDRETEDLYEFSLEAIDGGGGVLSPHDASGRSSSRAFTGVTTILLRIKDVNDNAPTFDQKSYSAIVHENTLPQMLVQFQITDLDWNENGRVFVNIQDPKNRANSLFRVVLRPAPPPASDYMVRYQGVNLVSSKPQGSYYTGYLHLLDYLDAEVLPAQMRFYIVATDNGQPQLSSKVEVVIDLVNVNDHAPSIIFLREGKRLGENRLTLPEVLTPLGSMVAEVHVTDADSSLSQLTCRITRETETFSLLEVEALNMGGRNAQSASFGRPALPLLFSSYRQFSIRTKTKLDREEKSAYMLTIMCSDNEVTNSLSKNASLHVSISDINDETPTFELSEYTGHVRENSANAEVRLVPPIHTTDADVGRNSLISYSIRELPNTMQNPNATDSDSESPAGEKGRSSFHASLFHIDPRSGKIRTTAELDCESVDRYSFLVVATDDGLPERRSSSATVNIFVDDVNDNMPDFDQYHYNFEIKENSPGRTLIGKVGVHDADKTEENRRVRFSLRGRPEDLFFVEVDGNTGEVFMRRPIDYERQSSITLTVVAENVAPLQYHFPSSQQTLSSLQVMNPHLRTGQQGFQGYAAEASIVISVLNVNDNRPEFLPISPHQKHIVFIWEQLPQQPVETASTAAVAGGGDNASEIVSKEDNNFSAVPTRVNVENRKFCEPIPYKVIDKDWDPMSQELCCTLSLEHNFDGLFALSEEVPNVLCALKRPPHPQSYKVTLVASDGPTNDNLSSQIQLSVIIRNGPDYSGVFSKPQASAPFFKNTPLTSSTSASRLLTEVLDAQQMEDPERLSLGDYDRKKAVAVPGYQMKMISILVSIAGIFCILLLLAIVALKCGIFDSQYFSFTKSSRNSEQRGSSSNKDKGSGVGLTAIKHDISTLPHPNQPRVNDYHTLGDCFPEEVFYMDQKQTPASQHKKQTLREGTYEISGPFTDVTNNNNGYNANILMTNEISPMPTHYLTSMPAFPNNSSTINVSSKQLYGSGPRTPLLVATLRAPPTEFVESHPAAAKLDVGSRSQPVLHKASTNRVLALNQYSGEEMRSTANPTFYVATEAYQTLDPLTLSKVPPPSRDSTGGSRRYRTDSCDPKVTFNLEVLPMGNKEGEGEEDGEQPAVAESSVSMGRMTKPTDLLDQGVMERGAAGSGEVTHRDLGFMYAKASAHHSSFV